MINLLPQQEKKNVNIEYKARLITVVLFFVLILTTFTLILASSVYVSMSFKEKTAKDQLANFLMDNQIESDIDFLKNTNKKLSILQTKDMQSLIYRDIFETIAEESGEISITGISYQSDKGEKGVLVNGISPNREQLLDFVKRLEQKDFSEVTVPVSSFVKIQDLNFSLSIKI